MKVNIYIFDKLKYNFPVKKRRVVKLVNRIIKSKNNKEKGKVNIIYCDNKKIMDLNKNYFNKDNPTDVIAFTLEEELSIKDDLFGEIYISVDQAGDQCSAYGSTIEEELMRLAAHGTLHLIGYDDSNDDLREEMHNKENFYLKKTGSNKSRI